MESEQGWHHKKKPCNEWYTGDTSMTSTGWVIFQGDLPPQEGAKSMSLLSRSGRPSADITELWAQLQETRGKPLGSTGASGGTGAVQMCSLCQGRKLDHLGLFENRVALNLLVNHHFPNEIL